MKNYFVLPYVLQATYLGGNEALQQLPTILTSSSHPVSVLTSSAHPVSVCNGQIPSVSFSTSQPNTGESLLLWKLLTSLKITFSNFIKLIKSRNYLWHLKTQGPLQGQGIFKSHFRDDFFEMKRHFSSDFIELFSSCQNDFNCRRHFKC